MTRRAAGILLHPTSLPGPYGIGELGGDALRFVDFLRESGQGLWQVLPLNPVDEHGSPYSSPSAFAGNPAVISTTGLVEEGLIEAPRQTPNGPADYASVVPEKTRRLREAHSRWRVDEEFRRFERENEGWLGDYALYMALRGRLGAPWNRWPEGLAKRKSADLRAAERDLEGEICFWKFVQSRFFREWREVKEAANEAGVEIIGDIPIFISHDSADVWANREMFHLDEAGRPTVVAGVPPDYFSRTGQLWGNPLYRWERMREDGYAWWAARIELALSMCDSLRLDHFRGFESYWEVPAEDETAKGGRWVKGPGEDLFEKLRGSLGDLPLIAEDLGEITDEVRELRRRVGLPGMKVLQFGFSHPENPFLPHNYEGEDWVVYTGTHDNDTTAGWWRGASRKERRLARDYLGREFAGPRDFVRLAHSSVAKWSVVPMQDVLGLGPEARMNEPGTSGGNWRWRMDRPPGKETSEWLRQVAAAYGRDGEQTS